ncbi:hypothetical protein HN51_064002 [Arachis hypogaea]
MASPFNLYTQINAPFYNSIIHITFLTSQITIHSDKEQTKTNTRVSLFFFYLFDFISDLVPSLELLKRGRFGAIAAEFEIGNGGRRRRS